ncbi:MAG: hypothetical protein RMY29_033380 [Nostoc sp. CreGUA01]|nr:hypothetical protein [Nostoc sp. CreGUA01]
MGIGHGALGMGLLIISPASPSSPSSPSSPHSPLPTPLTSYAI